MLDGGVAGQLDAETLARENAVNRANHLAQLLQQEQDTTDRLRLQLEQTSAELASAKVGKSLCGPARLRPAVCPPLLVSMVLSSQVHALLVGPGMNTESRKPLWCSSCVRFVLLSWHGYRNLSTPLKLNCSRSGFTKTGTKDRKVKASQKYAPD